MPTLSRAAQGDDARADIDRSPLRKMEQVLGEVNKFPLLPETATRAIALANQPDVALGQFARLVEQDTTLATGILKLANSPLYGFGPPASTLAQAVVRLGLKECRNLIVAIGMRGLFRNVPPSTLARCEILWRHSYATACLCRQLNRACSLKFVGEEFVAGLLHDLGRTLLAVFFPSRFQEGDPMDFREDENVLAHERDIHGTDHSQLGAWFGEKNHLPPVVLSAILHHHAPTAAPENASLVALVAAADHLANHMQRGEEPEAYDPAANQGLAVLSARWDERRRALLHQLSRKLLADFAREYNSSLV